MEKQYSTHYLLEKCKHQWFIGIYNFKIIDLKTQFTV